MIPFHSLFPDLAQKECRCVHLMPQPGVTPTSDLEPDEYAFVELYCDDLACDCRRVFLQVFAKNQPDKVLASINYGWEKEKFYAKKMPYDPDAPRMITRGSLDPFNEQSEFAEEFLDLFRKVVLDERYRLRLRRHYQLFREELARHNRQTEQQK